MFDIGFAELVIIGVVALIVIGPDRLPEAVRTASAWLNRLRRGFNDIKQEVQQELHNDAVLKELRESGEKLQQETNRLRREFSVDSLTGEAEDRRAAPGNAGSTTADFEEEFPEAVGTRPTAGASPGTTDRRAADPATDGEPPAKAQTDPGGAFRVSDERGDADAATPDADPAASGKPDRPEQP